MTATVAHGDCRELLRALPDNSLDSLCTDPPYGLGRPPPIREILTRWLAGDDVTATGGGFMGRSWDSFVPGPATWAEVFRVLKPGAHGVVFAGDRTVDLMAIALRLVGFEVRHVGVWVSAQVFPKSLDVSKAIDALGGSVSCDEMICNEVRRARAESGLSLAQVSAAVVEVTGGRFGAWYHRGGHVFYETGRSIPRSFDEWEALCRVLPIRESVASAGRAAVGELIAREQRGRLAVAPGQGEDRGVVGYDVTAPATPDAAKWSGWGTALKTIEPWILVRKPLSESTVARNVLRWGTGALNVDACRLPFASDGERGVVDARSGAGWGTNQCAHGGREEGERFASHESGRWPSALIAADLDVEGPAAGVRAMGEGASHVQSGTTAPGERAMLSPLWTSWDESCAERKTGIRSDGASELDGILGPYTRHFRIPGTDGTHDEAIPPEVESLLICPKASTSEREEGCEGLSVAVWNDGRKVAADNPRLRGRRERRNVHPTVKPVALLRHLVRLITPPGGTVLDTFTGSGSTGVAAVWEGFDFYGCELNDGEREPFVTIARARIAYAERTPPPELRCRAPKPEADERQCDLFGKVG